MLKFQNYPIHWMIESVVSWVQEKTEMSQNTIEKQEDRFLPHRIRAKFDENMDTGCKWKVRSVMEGGLRGEE